MTSPTPSIDISGLVDGGPPLHWGVTGDEDCLFVGSDPSCHWQVAGPGVAPIHFTLMWHLGDLWLVVRSPVWLDGAAVAGSRRVRDQAVIEFAGRRLRLHQSRSDRPIDLCDIGDAPTEFAVAAAPAGMHIPTPVPRGVVPPRRTPVGTVPPGHHDLPPSRPDFATAQPHHAFTAVQPLRMSLPPRPRRASGGLAKLVLLLALATAIAAGMAALGAADGKRLGSGSGDDAVSDAPAAVPAAPTVGDDPAPTSAAPADATEPAASPADPADPANPATSPADPANPAASPAQAGATEPAAAAAPAAPPVPLQVSGIAPAADERAAAEHLAAGRLAEARAAYQALAERSPSDRRYRAMLRIIERDIATRCAGDHSAPLCR